MNELNKNELALLILCMKIRVVDLRESGRAYDIEMNIIKKLKSIK